MSATPTSSQRVTHRAVLAIALPIMAANVSEPLIGVVDTAVIGRLPDPYYIGAVALGGVIFSVLFSAFGFLRMGTTGMTAQADGMGDRDELRAVLARALMIAGACGLALIVASPLLRRIAFAVIEGSQAVESHAGAYFDIRIWAAPFSLANYAFLGWFIGLGRPARPLRCRSCSTSPTWRSTSCSCWASAWRWRAWRSARCSPRWSRPRAGHGRSRANSPGAAAAGNGPPFSRPPACGAPSGSMATSWCARSACS
ncbi:hypothetical protein HW532_13000 [Kaustia mangrovi]|uniref:Multidrug resistance protein NorM n=1 Tax=Kaustia mangrovi TaxID=2593653 RepID=A0A7S8C508_9HYPH|nr:MATE family efflux transporter [Kaustia mangrovi]QPC43532.1 hypothetical protein HW532_13000 [Kaustia mangrovi]